MTILVSAFSLLLFSLVHVSAQKCCFPISARRLEGQRELSLPDPCDPDTNGCLNYDETCALTTGTWAGDWFDFHGECDLVLLKATEFGLGLAIEVSSAHNDAL
ncbi:expressed unknown protein [Seminavis robusta]|uniref:Uncharacterized protein n=1 Tax=Seminavis robusta TaxID=568900 RepID=A0A9N8DUI1_9STRA|nr:expressed unknown protein [Seminavis robusta]|eukprot:Sro367_g127730.1 n/a (103) ;mRNA; f:11074-11611